jgi:rod shape determining protein RodA
MTSRHEAFSNKIDWVTVALYCAIVVWGWLNIYAVTYDPETSTSIFNLDSDLGPVYAGRQLLFIAGAVIIIFVILIVDMRFYDTVAYLIYGVVLFLLLLVPLIGKEVGGNKAWLGIGSFGFSHPNSPSLRRRWPWLSTSAQWDSRWIC